MVYSEDEMNAPFSSFPVPTQMIVRIKEIKKVVPSALTPLTDLALAESTLLSRDRNASSSYMYINSFEEC